MNTPQNDTSKQLYKRLFNKIDTIEISRKGVAISLEMVYILLFKNEYNSFLLFHRIPLLSTSFCVSCMRVRSI
ncbi:MAG: hypothetical protein APR53_02800 [Methanoculleus sp. SDB]|nr:MAG: hypothetical protein APR53_02800 [Methanoculleus sp. SDB]